MKVRKSDTNRNDEYKNRRPPWRWIIGFVFSSFGFTLLGYMGFSWFSPREAKTGITANVQSILKTQQEVTDVRKDFENYRDYHAKETVLEKQIWQGEFRSLNEKMTELQKNQELILRHIIKLQNDS